MSSLVSVVIPVRNEENNLKRCLEALKNQTYEATEIVVVDNGSSDNSSEIARSYTDKVLYEPKPGIVFAKNTGVINSNGNYIFFTDADCEPNSKWVETLMDEFQDSSVLSAGGATILPESATEFERYIEKVIVFLSNPGARYGSRFVIRKETFHNPGCNVAYRREVFERLGYFDERLLTCEDAEFDWRIKNSGGKIIFNPDAMVKHHHRTSWKSFLRQSYRYSIGRIQAIKLHWKMAKWFHFVPSFFVFVILFALAGLFITSLRFVCVSLLVLLIGSSFVAALFLSHARSLQHTFIYFGLLWTWFLGWGVGFLRGLYFHRYIEENKT